MLATAHPILIFFLAALTAGGLLWSVFQPRLDGGSRASDRLGAVINGPSAAVRGALKDRARKKSVDDVLQEMAEQEAGVNGKKKPSLKMRIRQAGLNWSRRTFFLVGLIAGSISFAVATVFFGIGHIPGAAFGLAAALLIPNMIVNRRRKKRLERFIRELPDAVDVIVRGVKSGLPLSDCLKAIATDASEPVRSEFKAIVDDHAMGMTMADAVARLPERAPVPEATFFAIVIAIQSRSGGSLSEALGNLSRVVRERKKMKNKVQALSSEAKAGAIIIAAIPFFVGGTLSVIAPEYVGLLFQDLLGNIIIAVSAFWMLMGVLVMRAMINFDF